MKIFRFFWQYLDKYRILIIVIFLLMIANSFLNMLNPYISGQIVDNVIVKGMTDAFIKLIAILFFGIIIKSFLRYLSLLLIENVTQSFYFDMRKRLFSKILGLDFGYFDKTRTGDIMTRVTGDLDIVRYFFAASATVVFESAFSFIFVLMLMIRMNFLFTMILLATIPFIGFFTFLMTRELKPLKSDWHDQVTRLSSTVQENISGNRIVRAFANEEYETEKFAKENDGYKFQYMRYARIWSKYLPLISLFGGMMTVLVILVGGLMVINKSLSYGQLVVFSGLVGTLSVPINMANWLSDMVQRFITSGEKIIDVMKTEPKIKNSENSVNIDRLSGSIEFRNVSFRYTEENVLQNIDLKIESGQTIGIIGPTGSGKSTLINLISRFYDCTEGEVVIDGLNIRNIDRKKLRQNISLAMQDIFLFSDTIEGNVAYGVPDIDMEAIIEASKSSGAHEFVVGMSEGYDTIIGERGVGLSGGQKQRIALARALVKDSPFIILDDITSSVDTETEREIQKSLKSIYKGKTTFIISHRISSVKNADLILVLDKGKIVEKGTHEELLKNKGYYCNIFTSQSGITD